MQRCRVVGNRGVEITLTLDPADYSSPLDAYRRLASDQAVPLFLRKLSRALGVDLSGPGFGWVRKLEFQANGFPHFHLIVLGVTHIPHELIRECWGRGHVWIKRLRKNSAAYACKYLGKSGPVPGWVLREPERSVKIMSCSRGFWGFCPINRPVRTLPDCPPLSIYRTIASRLYRARCRTTVETPADGWRTYKLPLLDVLDAVRLGGGRPCGTRGMFTVWVIPHRGWADIERGLRSREAASGPLHLNQESISDAADAAADFWTRVDLCSEAAA